MCMDFVSVVIPSFNRAKVIVESIKSVLNQTYTNLEVVVVDDCSTDNTEEIVNEIDDSRVKYIKLKKNSGACVARNTGVDNSIGNIIAFHDSDDLWKPNKLEIEMNALKNNNADVVFCAITRHNYGRDDEVFPQLQEGFKTHQEIVEGFFVSTQTILGYKSIFEKYRFDKNVRRMQDYDLMVRIAEDNKVYFVKQALVDVYLQSDSISSNSVNQYLKIKESTELFLKKYKNYGEMYPEWKKEMYSRLGHCLVMLDEDATGIYKELLRLDKSKENHIKYILCRLHLLKTYFDFMDKKEKNVGERK